MIVYLTFLGRFLYNNLRQALGIIADYMPMVDLFVEKLSLEEGCFEIWLEEEKQFFADLKVEPEEKILEVAYIEALMESAAAEYVVITKQRTTTS